MKPRRIDSQHDAAALFDEAVHDRALAVLTLPAADAWRTYKCRFLERDPHRRFFVLDHQPASGNPPELAPGLCVGVSFRNHTRKILFASVVEAKGHFLFDDRTSVPAVRYRWPDSLTELQRRAYYRTPVPETTSLLATLWSGGADARTSAQAGNLHTASGTLADISCGGALIRLSQVAAPTWSEEETLGVELQLGDGHPPLLANACFRNVRHDELGQLSVAIQFVGLEMTVDGRLILQRLADCVQKFHRLSLGPGAGRWNRPQESR